MAERYPERIPAKPGATPRGRAAADDHRWRRPAAWSLPAVAEGYGSVLGSEDR